ncbi:MAG: 3-isopropylmalate dehydrogenase, partial [Salinibacterium sp.]
TAAILSVALLLSHLGETDAAARVTAAVQADLAARAGKRSTAQVGDAIAAAVAHN